MSTLTRADPPHAFETEVLQSMLPVVVESDPGIVSPLGRTA